MIEYKQHPTTGGEVVLVVIDGTARGEIRKVDGGFQFVPNGSLDRGEVFPTIEEVKQSLIG